MRFTIASILIFLLSLTGSSQDLENKIQLVNKEMESLETKRLHLLDKKENLKLELLRRDLDKYGLPKMESGEELVEHEAMSLVYDEKHEQAKWVAHVIVPDVTTGNAARSNDFREDPKVKTGTAVEVDYFLKETDAEGNTKYDGFGFDRGHLAPSADFRWSKKALSESYFYSNMSPQRPEFNREGWGELEAMMRGYMYHNPDVNLYVVTGPVLTDDLPVIERSVNKPSIPEYFFKVAIDVKNERAIGFLMPNQRLAYPTESFVKSIDEIEELTGIDFYHNLPEALETKLEKMTDVTPWMNHASSGDVAPIHPPSLPAGYFNTIQADRQKGRNKKVTVCGTVVQTKFSKKGNAMLYLDKNLTDPLFITFIRKDNLINFEYNPVEDLINEKICVSAEVGKIGETPTMFIENDNQIQYFQE